MFGFGAYSEFPYSDIFGIGEVPPTPDTHDGFTKEEIKRWKRLKKRLAEAEAAKIQARLDQKLQRKIAIEAKIDPQPVEKIEEPELKSVEVKEVIDLDKINAEIGRLEAKKQQLMKMVLLRNELANIQVQLAIHQAKLKAQELDEEESILALLL